MAETFCGSFVKEVSCFFECCERVCVENSSPGVTVIASFVTGCEDVVVERRAVTDDDLVNHAHLFEAGFLKGIHVKTFGCRQFMEIHVEDRSREEFCGHKSLVELAGIVDFLNQFIGNDFSSLIVEGVRFEHFGFVAVVLHELAGQFNEVAGRVRAAEFSVMRF